MRQYAPLTAILIVTLFSCQKNPIAPESITGGIISSDATIGERIWTMKNYGKYSDKNLAAARNGGGIVFGGNSIMERMLYSNWDIAWQGLPVINRALGGTTWKEQIPYIDDLFTVYKPRVIVLYNGENEYLRYPVSTNKEVSKTFSGSFIEFYNKLRLRNPQARIIINSMVACPTLFKRGYETYRTSSGKYIYDIDNINKIYRNKLESDHAATGIATRYVDIKPMYQQYFPYRWYKASEFDSDGIHIKLTRYGPWLGKLRPVVDSLYRNIQPTRR